MENIDIKNIPVEKFAFVQKEADLNDKMFKTKPVGFFKDAWRRFRKNKSSIVGMVIIVILLLFAIFVPVFSRYKVSDFDGYYSNTLPKLFSNAGGFWDGTKKDSSNKASYQLRDAMGVESGRKAVTKLYGVKMVDNAVAGKPQVPLYTYRYDSYNIVGYELFELSANDYLAIQKYQKEKNVQVLYPVCIESKMFSKYDGNYWYETYSTTATDGSYRKGEAVLDENGNYKPIYDLTADDNLVLDGATTAYDSLRIDGDDGSYRYARYNGSNGMYTVRVCYYDYYVYKNGYQPYFIFGANSNGQDLLICIASGTRLSLLIAFGVAVINFIIGAVYGAIEGYYGGATDLVMERISDILSGIPFMVAAILFKMHLAKSLGAIGALLFAFVVTGWIGTASTVRMQFYRYKNQEYVLAARTLGARDRRIIMKHIFPNALGTIVTSVALFIPSVIFSETSLSYLGVISLSDPPKGIISLGTLLTAGETAIATYPHIMLFPSLVISLLMISFNMFGNGLRDAFNPSLRGSE